MGLTLYLNPGKAPAGSQLPGNTQALLNFMAAYMGIAGAQNFNGINFGPNTPSSDNNTLPWFKTDVAGNPIGLFSWNGVAWAGIPLVAANGPTANRPANPSVGTEYYDTDIGSLLIFNNTGTWTTASGTIGDLKEVTAPDIGTALTANPGWIQHNASIGLVIGGAGPATGITAAHPVGQVLGEEAHTQSINEMASHTHAFTGFTTGASADGNTGPGGILSDHNPANTQATGGGQPANIIQPTLYMFRLVKTS